MCVCVFISMVPKLLAPSVYKAFKPNNTFRQKVVHPKDWIPKQKLSNVHINATKTTLIYIFGGTKQQLEKHMAQNRKDTTYHLITLLS